MGSDDFLNEAKIASSGPEDEKKTSRQIKPPRHSVPSDYEKKKEQKKREYRDMLDDVSSGETTKEPEIKEPEIKEPEPKIEIPDKKPTKEIEEIEEPSEDDFINLLKEPQLIKPVHSEFQNRLVDAINNTNISDYNKSLLNILNDRFNEFIESKTEQMQSDGLSDEEIEDKLNQYDSKLISKESSINKLTSALEKTRNQRKQIRSRKGVFAVGAGERKEQFKRDTQREAGINIPGFSKYEDRISNILDKLNREVINIKNELHRIISGFLSKKSAKESAEKRTPVDPHKRVRSLDNVLIRAIKASGKMFVDDPEGLDQYINELKSDHRKYSFEISKLVEEAMKKWQAYQDEKEGFADANIEEIPESENHNEWIKLSSQADKLLDEFKEKYDPKRLEKPLKDSEFRDQNWYSRKYSDYIFQASILPGAPPSIADSLKNLANRSKFISSAAKYPDINQVVDDKSLINYVIRGVKPLAHTKTHRREVKITREESEQIAYVLAPSQMGGGVIWYRPSRRAGERPYDERILGLNPEADKEERPTTKPYNPFAKDPNLDIVELYIWNNMANRSDPRLYNFINGLCLGYPRDYVIWFCESKYGQTDHRQPERSFWGSMLDRFRYCINAGVNGYGRPGNIKPDGMFSSIFKFLTPNFINKWVNKILGTSEELYNPQQSMSSVAAEFQPIRSPEKTEFEEDIKKKDPIIKSIYNKLDGL